MQNNRMLHISTAGSRKAIQWPGSTIMWSEFTEKLSTPVRGDETLEQYLAFPKAQQDELKDIGGFVGGTLRETAGSRTMWRAETCSHWTWTIFPRDRRMIS